MIEAAFFSSIHCFGPRANQLFCDVFECITRIIDDVKTVCSNGTAIIIKGKLSMFLLIHSFFTNHMKGLGNFEMTRLDVVIRLSKKKAF